ncbi:MAG: NAD(P)/FAD-dependent oxidoreductase [Eubacterium sp.]|nr:NAD(P)/FAD-dependent oxidoreductase [Eubacterium sp.]
MGDCVQQFYEKLKESTALKDYKIAANADTRKVMRLTGEVDTWQQVVDIGHLAGKSGVKGVINDLKVKGVEAVSKDRSGDIEAAKALGAIDSADIVIIGAGVSGSGIARTLAKYDKKIIVVEKASDVSEGTSKANNGMIHSGYDSKAGSLKALLNVKGNAMYTQWQEELHFKMNRCGSFVVGFDASDDAYIEEYYELGKKNGVPGIAILSGDEARAIDPALSHEVVKALWTPSAAYVEPYEVVEALMENAIDNGVKLMLNTEVVGFEKDGGKLSGVITDKGIIEAGCVINAAGLYADEIAEKAGDRFYTIHPRRGTLVILDKKLSKKANKCFIGTPPKNFTKGGGPTQTPEGNPLWGPSAIEVPCKDDLSVDEEDVRFVMEKGKHLTEGVTEKDIITYFSGCRAANYIEDFIIEASEVLDNFIHVAGIQSPGLASSPAIAERVEGIYCKLHPEAVQREDYNPIRPEHKAFRDCTLEEKEALIAENPLYGHVICRCETITEAEIVNAIHGKIPATTVDAVKRRTRAGMGRCQGGFCGPRVVEIIARELGTLPQAVTKCGEGSEILTEASREGEEA